MKTEKKKAKKVKKEVKSEPEEIHPLAHYVDDRLELISQVFNCLKGKNIKSFAPEELSVGLFTFRFSEI